MATQTSELQIKHISAENGQPSTFYSADGGQTWYTKKAQALGTEKGTAVNPNDYVKTKSFWDANKKTILVCIGIVALLSLIFLLWHKGVITLHVHK